MMRRGLFLLMGISFITMAHSASFNCAKARLPQEKLICFDYRLSDLDSRLTWVFTEVLKQGNDTALKQAQKNWMAAREKCTNVGCIMQVYVARIEELNSDLKLGDVYFPKSDIPWDSLSDFVGNLPLGLFVDGEFQLLKTGGREMVELGDMRLAVVASNYEECEGGLKTTGIYVERNLPWAQTGVLVHLRPEDWVPYRIRGGKVAPDCEEPAQGVLKINPAGMTAMVANQSLYLHGHHGSKFTLRMDKNLQTASPLLGKELKGPGSIYSDSISHASQTSHSSE